MMDGISGGGINDIANYSALRSVRREISRILDLQPATETMGADRILTTSYNNDIACIERGGKP